MNHPSNAQKNRGGPKEKDKHYSYNESVDETAKLSDAEPVEDGEGSGASLDDNAHRSESALFARDAAPWLIRRPAWPRAYPWARLGPQAQVFWALAYAFAHRAPRVVAPVAIHHQSRSRPSRQPFRDRLYRADVAVRFSHIRLGIQPHRRPRAE
jgi:hypothetical protein